MSEPVERELQRPCGWCGQAIAQPGGRRRLRRYCCQSCRQRAYEDRRAAARHAPDWEPPERAERIVEVQLPYPRTIDGWERALAALAGQLRDHTIGFWNRERVEAALDAVREALPDGPPGLVRPAPVRSSASAAPVPRVADDPVLRWLSRTGEQPTTLRLLASELAVTVEQIRALLAGYVAAGVVVARRVTAQGTSLVNVGAIADHARFTITVH